jgi:hypothetical protein
MTQASSSLIQVAGICGSLRQGSFTKMALHQFEGLEKDALRYTRLIIDSRPKVPIHFLNVYSKRYVI